MKIGVYNLDNEDKVKRAIYGVVTKAGQLSGGVGEDATDELKLAAYDRLGGLITKDGNKIKTGSFCDVVESKKQGRAVPLKEPNVVYLDSIDGVQVELDEEEAKSLKKTKEKKEKIKAKAKKR